MKSTEDKPLEKLIEVQVRIPDVEGNLKATIPVNVLATLDEDGEYVLTGEALQIIEDVKVRHMGLLTPEEISAIRKNLELTQAQISELLECGEKSWTRWETGKARPSRLVNKFLKAIKDGEISFQYLQEGRKIIYFDTTQYRSSYQTTTTALTINPPTPEVFEIGNNKYAKPVESKLPKAGLKNEQFPFAA